MKRIYVTTVPLQGFRDLAKNTYRSAANSGDIETRFPILQVLHNTLQEGDDFHIIAIRSVNGDTQRNFGYLQEELQAMGFTEDHIRELSMPDEQDCSTLIRLCRDLCDVLPEKGIVTAGDCVIGADSHTCTYGALGAFSTGVGSTDMAAGMATGMAWFKVPSAIKFVLTGKFNPRVSGKDLILHIIGMIGVDGALYKSMEFTGPGVAGLTMDDRLCICNMAIEAGAKNGIFPVDEVTKAYLKGRSQREPVYYEADPDAEYEKTIEIDLSALEPTVSYPHLPENTHLASEGKEIKIDQVVIGSCTNGRLEDMEAAYNVLKGKHIAKGVRGIIIPATMAVYKECILRGWTTAFIDAGCIVSTPTCGPCLGGYMGILAEGERCVSTTNRNFVGRMGHVKSEVYLASPATAAASALTGYITDPRTV